MVPQPNGPLQGWDRNPPHQRIHHAVPLHSSRSPIACVTQPLLTLPLTPNCQVPAASAATTTPSSEVTGSGLRPPLRDRSCERRIAEPKRSVATANVLPGRRRHRDALSQHISHVSNIAMTTRTGSARAHHLPITPSSTRRRHVGRWRQLAIAFDRLWIPLGKAPTPWAAKYFSSASIMPSIHGSSFLAQWSAAAGQLCMSE